MFTKRCPLPRRVRLMPKGRITEYGGVKATLVKYPAPYPAMRYVWLPEKQILVVQEHDAVTPNATR